jgi:glycosyltransferase involved in cell wall biosynthesis
MKIVVDGFNLSLEKGTGVATYARNLTYNVHELGHHVGVLYGGRRPPDKTPLMSEISFFDEHAGKMPDWLQRIVTAKDALRHPFLVRAAPVVLSGDVIYKQFASRMPYFDALWNSPKLFDKANFYSKIFFNHRLGIKIPGGGDIMHWTYPLPLAAKGFRNIYTLHDLIPLRLPFTSLDRKRDYFRMCSHLARVADHIVTVSECSRRDIINLLGVPEDKVTNTYQSVEIPQRFLDVPVNVLRDELAGTFRLDHKKYLLFYGSIEPKKNISRMIEAYLGANLDIPLVIVGAQAWKSEQELRLLIDENIRSLVQTGAETRVKRRIIKLDYATFPQLVNLIRGATAVVFPSLYEGFGLPVLEGMICGTPVITANAHSTVEIAGDGAVLVDPYDTRAIKEAIIAIVNNEDLQRNMIAAGRKIAARYSAAAYRERLTDLYKRVMSKKAN